MTSIPCRELHTQGADLVGVIPVEGVGSRSAATSNLSECCFDGDLCVNQLVVDDQVGVGATDGGALRKMGVGGDRQVEQGAMFVPEEPIKWRGLLTSWLPVREDLEVRLLRRPRIAGSGCGSRLGTARREEPEHYSGSQPPASHLVVRGLAQPVIFGLAYRGRQSDREGRSHAELTL